MKGTDLVDQPRGQSGKSRKYLLNYFLSIVVQIDFVAKGRVQSRKKGHNYDNFLRGGGRGSEVII